MLTPAMLAARLALAYPDRLIDAGHLASWAEVLGEYELDVAAEAVERLRREYRRPPPIRDLLDVLDEVLADRSPARPALPSHEWTAEDEELAREAWQRAMAEWREWQRAHPAENGQE